jgi:hypothetical protein
MGEYELPRPQAERLQFIEDRLFWVGRVGSADVRRRFDVSKAQAAQDIALYREAQPVAILYETKLKTFVPAAEFQPLYARQSLERFLGLAEREDFTEGQVVDFAVLQPPGRKVDLHIAQTLVRAILREEEVEVDYVSLSSGLRRRWLAPHAMASDGMRVHVRAYDYGAARFSDFVTGRIQEAHAIRPRRADISEDAAWFDILNLELVPNPHLARDRREAVRRDYGFTGEVLVVPVRRAMLIYLNTRLLLHSELAGMPHAEVYRQLVPQDQAAFDALLDSVRGEPAGRFSSGRVWQKRS